VDVVIITPEPGMHKEIGQRLLALAEHPRDVQWVTWPAPGGYSIPLELFVKFDTDGPATGGIVKPGQAYVVGEDGPPPSDPPRRRRRNKESTDNNNTSEEE
jgi:hypothetical protein